MAKPGGFQWLANANRPSSDAAAESVESGAENTFTVWERFEGLVVLTPTCDIHPRDKKDRPFVTVCPLVELPDEVDVGKAKDGYHIRYVHVPGASDPAAFADLDRTQTIETGLLEECERIPGLHTDEEQADFARAVARKFNRFAFPDALQRAISKWRNKVVDSHSKPNSAEGQLFRDALTIRAAAEPSWSENSIEVTIYVIMPDGWLPESSPAGTRTVGVVDELARMRTSEIAKRLVTESDDQVRLDLVEALQVGWTRRCRPADEISDVSFVLIGANEFTYADVEASQSLDLDFVSGEDDEDIDDEGD